MVDIIPQILKGINIMSADHKTAASTSPKTEDKANISSAAPASGASAKPAEAVKPAAKS
tara:strand:- start:440 stop:616 length:177 start_codon:yes stop_codon:yes gene_type:complete